MASVGTIVVGGIALIGSIVAIGAATLTADRALKEVNATQEKIQAFDSKFQALNKRIDYYAELEVSLKNTEKNIERQIEIMKASEKSLARRLNSQENEVSKVNKDLEVISGKINNSVGYLANCAPQKKRVPIKIDDTVDVCETDEAFGINQGHSVNIFRTNWGEVDRGETIKNPTGKCSVNIVSTIAEPNDYPTSVIARFVCS